MRKSELKNQIDKIDLKFENQISRVREKYREERKGFEDICKHIWDNGNPSLIVDMKLGGEIHYQCLICGRDVISKIENSGGE